VKPLTVVSVCEAYDIHEPLEAWVADQKVGRITRGDLIELRRRMKRGLPLVGPGRLEAELFETHQAFHAYLVGLSGNDLLRESYRRLSVNALTARAFSGHLDSGTDGAAEHVEAFPEGDLQRLGAAIGPRVETGERFAREAIDQAGRVL
jgi:DNA-binding GntR family transcriptional regulator